MNFFDILQQTSYSEETKNYVASFIMDYFSESKLHNIYLVSKSFSSSVKENIFLIQKTIYISVVGETKIVRILIYIPTNFPKDSPKFYLERAKEHSIVNMQKDINKLTYEITLKSISEWKGIGDFNRILDDIINSFSRFYPLYKLESHKRKGIVYPENSYVPTNALKISLNDEQQMNHNKLRDSRNSNANMLKGQIASMNDNNINYNVGFNQDKNSNVNITSNFYKPQENKQEFTDEEIKRMLAEHTILAIKDKFLQNYYENKKIKISLDEIKNNLKLKTNEIGDKLIEGKKILYSFDKLLKELNNEIANIKDNIIVNSRLHLSFDNYRNFIEISDKEEHILKFISMESTLDDVIYILRKAFEKDSLTFDETMKYIRKISKEIFLINFLKKKLIEK